MGRLVGELLGLLRLEEVSVDEHALEVQAAQVVYSSEVVLAVLGVLHEVVLEHAALLGELLGHGTEDLHEEGEVVVVLLMVLTWPRIEEEGG